VLFRSLVFWSASFLRWAWKMLVDCFALTVATMVIQQIVLTSCDIVGLVMSVWMPRGPARSLRWCAYCLAVWSLVLAAQVPILLRVLPEQPVLLSWAQTALVSRFYRTLLHMLFGKHCSAGFLSSRTLQAHKNQGDFLYIRSTEDQECRRKRSQPALTKNSVFYILLIGYATSRFRELRKSGLWTLITCCCWVHIEMKRTRHCRGLSMIGVWKVLWEILPMPVHSGCEAVDGECELHQTCAVCLDSLCISSEAVAASSLGVLRRRRLALSSCRLCPSGAIAGLAGARSWGTDLYKSSFSGVAKLITVLPCGHRFHLGCIDDVIKTRFQCPTCRGSLGDVWADMSDEEHFSIKLGWCAVIGLWIGLWASSGRGFVFWPGHLAASAVAAAAAATELPTVVVGGGV